ncbi:L-ascorbate 6-phosphate lactonase [Suicoccus acidiformans]|uniref:L-ascorbate 6-phosphate lactonase n=1 Tax=Suicoccus acidiformans TaxID=2036206 RepID=A0A347WIG6_9LACT|nr:L-ascorbate 6-phosphate lactonase [Suicoccus acidiformans]AXY24873.1 L-ascorbate 6-phosphate lactonase [Suicoccus acidiformans]
MKHIEEVTKQAWLEATFPEWGTYLNEEIANTEVPEGSFSMWWLGCCGIWLKTHEGTNIVMDMWNGTGKRTRGDGQMKKGHQMMRMAGVRNLQPNRRNEPFVIDPFEIKDVDALVVSHIHSDHLDIVTAAAVANNCPDAKFIGPAKVVEKWIEWGVPEERTVTVVPGDRVTVGAVEVVALEAFDNTALITVEDPEYSIREKGLPFTMDEVAVNILFETSGGNLYHGADSHYSVMFAKHGKEHDIDVALANFGENPVGIHDKLTSADVLRMAEALRTKVIIPVHHDIWTNFYADPEEIVKLWEFKKDRLQYNFQPFVWQVGGEYQYPRDTNRIHFMFDRGFHDHFEHEQDLPYDSFL